MLKELRIKNFALIDELFVCFEPGLNILTGETGAGKTLLINALNLILGGRASTDYIRSGEDFAEVETAFSVNNSHPIFSKLKSSGFYCSDEEDLIIRRIIFRSNKANRCYLNGHLAPLSLLIDIGAWLIDIHGQHDHQILLNPELHLDILDHFAGLEPIVEKVTLSYNAYNEILQKKTRLIEKRDEAKREHDLLAFQREQIDRANIKPGEEEALIKQQDLLKHAAKIQELLTGIDRELYQSEGSVCETLGNVNAKIRELSLIDPQLKPVAEIMDSQLIQIEDIAYQLRDYANKKDFSPQCLEEIEERLDQIFRLKKKYQLTSDGIIKLREEIENRWQFLEDYEDTINSLSDDMQKKWEDLKNKASQLSKQRMLWAKRIEKEVEAQLRSLEMNQARFVVAFFDSQTSQNCLSKNITSRGFDKIEFLFSANIGEEPKPIYKIASGGEISRVMLAIKSCLAQADQVLTLVFDEIDSGIGGKTAVTVGQKMKELAKNRQIICITHLPQIACNANAHHLVSKRIINGKSLTVVNRISGTEQIKELAKMMAGDPKSEIALQHATRMIEQSKEL
ncbi:DNA repair protein RecN [bacterium]|nr:DNA repair protein RecN [bacterium]